VCWRVRPLGLVVLRRLPAVPRPRPTDRRWWHWRKSRGHSTVSGVVTAASAGRRLASAARLCPASAPKHITHQAQRIRRPVVAPADITRSLSRERSCDSCWSQTCFCNISLSPPRVSSYCNSQHSSTGLVENAGWGTTAAPKLTLTPVSNPDTKPQP